MLPTFAIFIFPAIISNKFIQNTSTKLSNLYSYVNLLKNERYYATIQMLPPLDRQGKGGAQCPDFLFHF